MNITKQAVIKRATGVPKGKPMIYFLMDGDEIVYVGQASNLIRAWMRIYSHQRSGKVFDRFSWFEIDGDPNEVEAAHIIKFDPKYNFTIPQQETFKWLNTLSRLSNITPARLRKKLKACGVLGSIRADGRLVYKLDEVKATGIRLDQQRAPRYYEKGFIGPIDVISRRTRCEEQFYAAKKEYWDNHDDVARM